MVSIVVTGAAGKMGQRITALACRDKEFNLVGAVEARGHAALGKDAGLLSGCGTCGINISDGLEALLTKADVVIDFSHADATLANLKMVSQFKKAAVVGTTGHTPDQKKSIESMGRELPLVFAPNMSVEVNLMWNLLGIAAKVLAASDVTVSIRETHHVHKKDKPSGTALEIQRILKNLKIVNLESKREGEVVGDHTVFFDNPQESLEITHRAKSRDTFAAGALRAAKWIVGKPNGLYTMKDVLGL